MREWDGRGSLLACSLGSVEGPLSLMIKQLPTLVLVPTCRVLVAVTRIVHLYPFRPTMMRRLG